ncbi:ADL045Wp [Eremothecium gossypii ATCC 10895]|uniref:ADL045Wp n=1 Tax=Eremothecium gossypii (strain ATCC 10895 / CBS 109.51 / FGSC 9923 / NRRL Y-1056) TaxID=284811 RepID=Q75AG3_EREGS|nr:ADL045Wp [Eremothecium gossypii ATCC 10895]AAS51875.1 ADL045Wp [Eremothecium gossypii ATCC 10895]AEY96173.1 FADL045Wp [Eremothecium gossypii FDAG1]
MEGALHRHTGKTRALGPSKHMFSFGNQSGTGGAQGSSGLFGQAAAQPQTGAGSGGLFGQTTASGATTGTSFGQTGAGGAATGGGLFGQQGVSNSGGLFGQNAGGSSGGLFGRDTTGTAKPGGLFGTQSTGGGAFGSKPAATGGLFGGAGGGAPGALFGTQAAPQPQPSALHSIAQLPITSMTRIGDLPPQVRQEIEQLDQYIQRQVAISHHLRAEEDEHLELISSIPRDVQFIMKTYSLTTQSLQQDLKRIQAIKALTDDNIRDSECFSLILNQLLTPGTKVSSAELQKFFQEKIQLYRVRLDEYFRVLSDIKSAVNGLDSDMFGSQENSTEYAEPTKTGINSIVATVIEEFELFMDMAERVAQLHQRVKELNGSGKNPVISS